MPSNTSMSTLSSPQSSARTQQNPTVERIAKYTVVSSLVGAAFTAVYESTIGRARAIRELERAGASANANVTAAPVSGQSPTLADAASSRMDVARSYRHNTALLSAAAALNSGLVALAFFGLREYFVSPALTRSRGNSEQINTSNRPLTWSAMRSYHVEDTALTGALLGGAFNVWKKGPKGVFPGAFTASLACTALQLIVNELDVRRVRYISQSGGVSSTSAASSSLRQELQEQPFLQDSANERTTQNSRFDADSSSAASIGNTEPDEKPGLGERMLTLIGITKVDDTEYLQRLKAKRDVHLARIRKLEAQIEKEKRSAEFKDGPEVDRDEKRES